MESVQKYDNRPPMKVGIGRITQKKALFEAGAERVVTPTELLSFWDHRHLIARKGDVVMMLEPLILEAKQKQELARSGALFQVVGHEPLDINNKAAMSKFRKQKPIGDANRNLVQEKRGRPQKYTATDEQKKTIASLWHSAMTPTQVRDTVAEMFMVEPESVSKSYARNIAIELYGTGARKLPDQQ